MIGCCLCWSDSRQRGNDGHVLLEQWVEGRSLSMSCGIEVKHNLAVSFKGSLRKVFFMWLA